MDVYYCKFGIASTQSIENRKYKGMDQKEQFLSDIRIRDLDGSHNIDLYRFLVNWLFVNISYIPNSYKPNDLGISQKGQD